jgi:hypothetical protein
LKIYKNPSQFKYEFEDGIGYEATVFVDEGWEQIHFSSYDKSGDPITTESTKWIKQSSLLAMWKHEKQFRAAEKRIHKAVEQHYKKNIFFSSILDEV